MILYYNREGIGDTLIVYLREGGKQTVQRKNDVARIFDEATNETLGLNFFNASQFLEDQATGAVTVNASLIEVLNQKLTDASMNLTLPVDVKPLIVTGYVSESKKHPDSDHMHVCRVDCGDENLQIVCGAPNIEQGQKVVVAKIGALMPSGIIIRPTVLRGVSSDGMICSARELALVNAPQKRGILVLNSETQVGQDFNSLIAKEMHV